MEKDISKKMYEKISLVESLSTEFKISQARNSSNDRMLILLSFDTNVNVMKEEVKNENTPTAALAVIATQIIRSKVISFEEKNYIANAIIGHKNTSEATKLRLEQEQSRRTYMIIPSASLLRVASASV